MLLSRRWCFLQPLLGPTRPQKALLLLVSRTIKGCSAHTRTPRVVFFGSALYRNAGGAHCVVIHAEGSSITAQQTAGQAGAIPLSCPYSRCMSLLLYLEITPQANPNTIFWNLTSA